MNHSGEAAEQIVRLSLEGVEVAAKITGSAAKEIAVLLIAALKNKYEHLKTHGKARLTSMLKSNKALEIFSVKESDLKSFMKGAKQYGIVYCVLRNTKGSPDGLCDIMVKADDAPKISRLVERLNLATVEKAKIENETVSEKGSKTVGVEPNEPNNSNIGDTEKLLNELLGAVETKPEPTKGLEDNHPLAPGGKVPPIRQFEPTSESRSNSAKGIMSKPSVKKELREIKAAITGRNKHTSAVNIHKQPLVGGKLKFKKSKERF